MSLLQLHEPGETPAPHEDENNIAIGIDLGTTHSVIAHALGDQPEIISDIHGHSLVPSVVQYDGAEPLVGTAARDARAQGKSNVIASIKRLMGKGEGDVAPLMGTLPYALSTASGGMVQVIAGGKARTPVEVSADILRHLKHSAEHALGHDVKQAVITVPAYFDDAARTATRDAARLAGLNVLRLVNEPTAAALAYGLESGVEGIYAIYDLGGGTFDISLLKLEKGIFQVLATGGDTQLGGDDFDNALVEYVAEKLFLSTDNREAIAMISAACRTAKEELSHTESTTITVDGNQLALSRSEFEKLAAPYIEQSFAICRQAIHDSGVETSDIKGVVLVGGSTRVPLVKKQVEAFFGTSPLDDVNPDEVVAIGAALQAKSLTQGSHTLLLDVLPLSLGLETMGGLTEKLLQRNTPIPTSVSQEFTTYQDGQTAMKVHIVQGEREKVEHNRTLAHFDLRGIPQLPAGIARIEVTFSVDADGLLTVSAEEKTTGTRQHIEVKPAYGLEEGEIERMLKESMAHAREDITERLLVETRVDAERNINEVLSAMKADPHLLSETETRQILRQIDYLNEAIEGNDRERIDIDVQQLAQVSAAFAQRRMDNAINSALKGADINAVESDVTPTIGVKE